MGLDKLDRRFKRYVALGDSFTEGVGDPDDTRPNGLRGWADRVAEVLAAREPDFGYANLAIRGRKMQGIVEEQLDPAIKLGPDLVTIHAGANDILRPRVDLDALATAYDEAVARLRATGATVLMFASGDPGSSRLYAPLRGRWAIYNEHVRETAARHGALLVDMWGWRDFPTWAAWAEDRLHLNSFGHTLIAARVLDQLGVPHQLETTAPPRPEVEASRRADLAWARQHAVPWVHRRLTGRSSGDGVDPKRPELAPISAE